MGNKKIQKKHKARPCNKKRHLPKSYRNNAQNRGTVPRKKVGSPMKNTRRKEREIPRRKEAQKGLKPH